MLNENVRSLDAQTLPQWVDEALNAVNPSAGPAIATQTMEAVRKSSMFTEEETLVAGALRRVTVFQHELIGKYLAARHLRTFLGPPVASTLVEAATVGRLREVFQFLIDELEGTQLNNLLSAVVTEGGDARLRVAAYALDVKPEQVTPEVRDAYLTASVIEAVRKT